MSTLCKNLIGGAAFPCHSCNIGDLTTGIFYLERNKKKKNDEKQLNKET